MFFIFAKQKECEAGRLPSRPNALLGTVALGTLWDAGSLKSTNKREYGRKLERIADNTVKEVWSCYSFFLYRSVTVLNGLLSPCKK